MADEVSCKKIKYSCGNFKNKNGLNIFCHYWKMHSEPKALLLIAHGYAEHSLVYRNLAKTMAEKEYFVFAHDIAGHGQSEGKRGSLNNIQDFVSDTVTHVQIVKKMYPRHPLYVFGRSFGGSVSILASLEMEIEIRGMVLCSPGLESIPGCRNIFTVSMLQIFDRFMPEFPLFPAFLGQSFFKEEKIKETYNDPLMYGGWVTTRTILSFFLLILEIHSRAKDFKVPFLLFHGNRDIVCHIGGSRKFFANAASEDKTFKVYDGSDHHLYFEPEEVAQDVMVTSVQWLTDKLEKELLNEM